MEGLYTWLEALPISTFIRESNSLLAFPTFLFMHTFGVSLVAGGSTIINLALLGMWPKGSIKPLEKMYPVMWLGFWINLITGFSLLVADAAGRLGNPVFYIKILGVIVGVAVLMMMRKRVFGDPNLDTAPIPGSTKMLAWISIGAWFVAILGGRLLAYTG